MATQRIERGEDGRPLYPTLVPGYTEALIEQRQHTRTDVLRSLAQQLDPALGQAVQEARAGLIEAQGNTQAARTRLTEHDQARPRTADGVPAWASKRTTLASELSAYEAIEGDAQQTLMQAERTLAAALESERQKQTAALVQRGDELAEQLRTALADLDTQRQKLISEHEQAIQPIETAYRALTLAGQPQ